MSGPIDCTRGERISIRITVTQSATGAPRAQSVEEPLHRRSSALAGQGAGPRGIRFQNGSGRVCAVAKARTGTRVTDRRRWCERVNVAPTRGRGMKTVAEDV